MRNRFNEVKIEESNLSRMTVLVSGRARERSKVSDTQLSILSTTFKKSI